MLPADLWQGTQVAPLALGLQLVSSASELLQEAGPSEQSAQPLTYPFADVGASFAFANCFHDLLPRSMHDWEAFRFTRTISESLLDVLLQGARKIAEDPGAPGMWPMVLAHLVPFTVVAFSALDASTQQSLALRCCTLLDCGLQLVNDEPPLATREAIAIHGASASAESALAAGVLALYTVLMLNSISVATAPSLIRLGQLCPAAVRALAQLMQRCTAQLSEPAASLMLLLPSPQQLLYPRDNYLQA